VYTGTQGIQPEGAAGGIPTGKVVTGEPSTTGALGASGAAAALIAGGTTGDVIGAGAGTGSAAGTAAKGGAETAAAAGAVPLAKDSSGAHASAATAARRMGEIIEFLRLARRGRPAGRYMSGL
jgi:hypothetical protein